MHQEAWKQAPSSRPIHSSFSYNGRPVEPVDRIIDEYDAESARLGAPNGGVGPPEHSPVRVASGLSPLLG